MSHRSPHLRLAAVVVAAIALLTACDSHTSKPTTTTEPKPSTLATLDGVFGGTGACPWVENESARYALMLPSSYKVTGTGQDLRLTRASGELVARAGQKLELVGGTLGRESRGCDDQGIKFVFKVNTVQQVR